MKEFFNLISFFVVILKSRYIYISGNLILSYFILFIFNFPQGIYYDDTLSTLPGRLIRLRDLLWDFEIDIEVLTYSDSSFDYFSKNSSVI